MTGKIDFDFDGILQYYNMDFTDYYNYKDNDIELTERIALYKNHLKAKIAINAVKMVQNNPTPDNVQLLRDVLDYDGNEHLYIVY